MVRFLAAAALAALASVASANLQSCVTTYDPATDYFPDKAVSDPKSGFSVTYFNNYKVVTNLVANTTTYLYQCGTPAPNATAGAKVISVPVTNVSLVDTTSATFVELLGRRSTLEYVDGVDYIVSPCIQLLNQTGKVFELESANKTLQEQQYGMTSIVFGSPFDPQPEINFISFSASSGSTPIYRASWINFVALFYNLEKEAAAVLASINSTYSCVSAAAKGSAPATAPVIAWVQYTAPSSYNNNTASWQFNNASYKLAYSRDAGLNPIAVGTKYTKVADFQAALTDVDYLIDETFLGTTTWSGFLSSYGLTENSTLKFVKNKQVYRTDLYQNSQSWTAWFEQAVPLAHVVLSDLAYTAYPASFNGTNYTPVFLRNVAGVATTAIKGTTAAQCANASAALPVGGPDKCPAAVLAATGATAGTKSGAGRVGAGVVSVAAVVAAIAAVL